MQVGKDLILVSGATGQQGGAVIRELLANHHKVRAVTRKPEGAQARSLKKDGAEVVHADLNDPASLKAALDGVWGAFSVQNTWDAGVEQEEVQGKRFAELAQKAGVRHFVYTSVASADQKTGIPHFDNKWRVEQRLRELSFSSMVILRPVFFMENWTSPWFKPAIDQGKLMIGLQPSTMLQMVALADIGRYGRMAFEKHAELNGRAIEIAGDQRTMPETAEILSMAAGRTIEFERVPIGEVRKFSEDFALMLEWFDRYGYAVDIKGNAKQYAIHATSLAEWAQRQNWAPAEKGGKSAAG